MMDLGMKFFALFAFLVLNPGDRAIDVQSSCLFTIGFPDVFHRPDWGADLARHVWVELDNPTNTAQTVTFQAPALVAFPWNINVPAQGSYRTELPITDEEDFTVRVRWPVVGFAAVTMWNSNYTSAIKATSQQATVCQ